MEPDPCSPTFLPGNVEGGQFPDVSLFPLHVRTRCLAIHPQEASPCAFPCLTLLLASKKAQRGTIAPAIAFVIASATLIDSLYQLQHSVEVHQGGDAALSCRLCLIACNSRQFDEVQEERESGRDR